MKPKSITVVIPYYKNPRNLDLILNSMHNQSHHPDEIIVVDDDSPDDISEIISENGEVFYIRNKTNRGVAFTRNVGLYLSKSEITVFIDGDAIPEATMLEAIGHIYDIYGETIAGVGGRGVECRLTTASDVWRARHASQDYGLRPRLGVPFLFGLCCSYKTQVLTKIGGFDNSFSKNVGEDYELGLRLSKAGYKLAYSPDIVVNHQHKDDFLSLRKGQYLWSYWEFVALVKNKKSRVVPFIGHVKKFITLLLIDLLIYHDLPMVIIDIKIFFEKFKGLVDASKNY